MQLHQWQQAVVTEIAIGKQGSEYIYLGKIHGGKSVLGVHVARGEFGEKTRFYCSFDVNST